MTGNDHTWHQMPHPGAGGPHIYIHPHTAGIPTIALPMVQDVLALRQEEEESGHQMKRMFDNYQSVRI